ncbi:MAG: hypothetical protein GTO02_16860 [Candidatus Dadabacteria bacterium]|nr:hypothetical protein [Candidatus Dadabacteria bacterium]
MRCRIKHYGIPGEAIELEYLGIDLDEDTEIKEITMEVLPLSRSDKQLQFTIFYKDENRDAELIHFYFSENIPVRMK